MATDDPSRRHSHYVILRKRSSTRHFPPATTLSLFANETITVHQLHESRNSSFQRSLAVVTESQSQALVWENYQVFSPELTTDSPEFPAGRSRSYRGPRNYSSSSSERKPVFKVKLEDQVRRYKCFKCLKSYRWKHHLVEHVKAFCGQKKAECCPYCSYRSNRKWNLKSHMKRIHADA
ncbi:hypothetical protein KM043_007674 [Ampulex compressa]|nr:hypothetical protein KM043_007674 [Ampulex compressa]